MKGRRKRNQTIDEIMFKTFFLSFDSLSLISDEFSFSISHAHCCRESCMVCVVFDFMGHNGVEC